MEKYLELVDKKWTDQNIDKRYNRVLLLSRTDDVEQLENELNKLDQSITEILRHAEKKCSKLPNSNLLQWSPQLKEALDNLKACRMLCISLQYIQPGQSVHDASRDYHNARQAYDEAMEQYRMVKENHVELRKEYLKQLAADLAEKNLTDELVELNKLRNIEKIRTTHMKCKYVLKPACRDGVQSILIPSKEEYPNDDIDHLSVDEMWKLSTLFWNFCHTFLT